jgi:hypothetical protein
MVLLLIFVIPILGFMIVSVARRQREVSGSWWRFYTRGKEAGFSFHEIRLLRELADLANVPDPVSVFRSRSELDTCIRSLVRRMRLSGDEDSANQDFLSRLYEYRKRIEIDNAASLSGGQKRNSVRLKTHRSAFFYIIQDEADRDRFEVTPGARCFIEDLSDTGCSVSIADKAERGMRVKIQFVLDNVPLGMSGTVRSIEDKEDPRRALLHIEADPLPNETRNYILGEVFGMLSE